MPDGEGAVAVALLRHGEVEGYRARTVRGHLDAALSAEGLRQHEALVSWLAAAEEPPELVLCSDLSRCADLGQRLAAASGAPLQLSAELREQHMGAWEGRTWEQISAQHGRAVNDYWDDYVRATPPGGESLERMAERVLACWRREVLPQRGRRLAVVTHIGPIRALLCQALGLPLDVALRFAPPAASHTSLLLAEAGAVVQGMGERPWLEGAPAAGEADVPARTGAAPARGPRLALSGSAGTGKTTLGRRLAEALGVPFLEEGMRVRLAAGLDLHRLDHRALRELVEDLWREQHAAEEACPDGFVADRSAADYAAFWIHYGFHHELASTEPWMAATLQHLQRYDRVVLLPWGVLPLAGDGVRSTNRWVQFMFQSLVEGLLARHARPGRLLRLPPSADADARLRWVLERVPARAARG
jgi:broad specificity phosphatase PhoE/nicotinamide riboside kinase